MKGSVRRFRDRQEAGRALAGISAGTPASRRGRARAAARGSGGGLRSGARARRAARHLPRAQTRRARSRGAGRRSHRHRGGHAAQRRRGAPAWASTRGRSTRSPLARRGCWRAGRRLYRGHSSPVALSGKTVILVDDGLATGATMRTAVASREASRSGPHRGGGADGAGRNLHHAGGRGRRGGLPHDAVTVLQRGRVV